MSWLRVADGFMRNPKIVALTDREFRVWMRVLCHCAEARDGTVDDLAIEVIVGLGNKLVSRYVSLGLLDPCDTPSRTPSHTPSRTPSHTPSRTPSHTPSRTRAYVVHDWRVYQPLDSTAQERQAARRAKLREEASRKRHGARHGSDRDENRDETVTSRAGARGSRPVPKNSSSSQSVSRPADDPATDGLTAEQLIEKAARALEAP